MADLSPEEQALVDQFRKQMGDPGAPAESVNVQHESLGRLMDGTKIQFRPGDGKEYSPALPKAQRWAARERRRIEAQQAAKARAAKGKLRTASQHVEEYKRQLSGRNVREAIEFLQGLQNIERSYALLAEEMFGGNRVSVMKSFPPVDHKVRAQYESEQEVLREYAQDATANEKADLRDDIAEAVSQVDPA